MAKIFKEINYPINIQRHSAQDQLDRTIMQTDLAIQQFQEVIENAQQHIYEAKRINNALQFKDIHIITKDGKRRFYFKIPKNMHLTIHYEDTFLERMLKFVENLFSYLLNIYR